ncbi:MAG: RNA polymerase subunit sigma-70 [Eubacteriales bacterium]|nr:RNA polymerase subunit sigma-70 [Eubacteriales bacterium]
MNAQQKDSIVHLRGEGVSYSKISEMLKISENTIKSFCRRNNLGSVSIEAHEPPIGHFCHLCGKPLTQTAGAKQKKFCSDKCRMSWWNSHPEAVNHRIVQQITCKSCGKLFASNGSRVRKYCSRSCYALAKVVRI